MSIVNCQQKWTMHHEFKSTIIFIILYFTSLLVNGQELEPRAYAALPKNMNALLGVYALSSGNVITEPTLPIKDFKITTHNIIAGYVHTFGLAKKLARIQVTVPFAYMAGKLQINGRDTSGARLGLGDTRVRFGINLTGAPAIDKKDFRKYTQKTIVGVSLVASLPTGLYYDDKQINIGNNRWALKPEIGVSKKINRIYAEAYVGVWFFTNNTHYLINKTLEQQPVFNAQAHASYYFKNNSWISTNTTWFRGGQTIIDNKEQGNLLENWRVGATWGFPIAKGHALKLQFHVGAFTQSNYDYKVISLGYQWLF